MKKTYSIIAMVLIGIAAFCMGIVMSEPKFERDETTDRVDGLFEYYIENRDSVNVIDTLVSIGRDEKYQGYIISMFEKYNKKHPEIIKFNYVLGDYHYSKGEWQEAIEYYKKIHAIDPEEERALFYVADIYHEQGDYENSLKYAKMMDDSNDIKWHTVAEAYYDLGMLDEAIDAIDNAICIDGRYYYYYFVKGSMLENAEEPDSAAIEDCYFKCLMKDQYNTDAYMRLGRLYLAQGKTEEANSFFDQALMIEEVMNLDHYLVAPFIYIAKGNFDKAEKTITDALKKNQAKENYYDAACVFAQTGKYDESLKYLKLYLENGGKRIAHIRMDWLLDPIKEMKEFERLMKKYSK